MEEIELKLILREQDIARLRSRLDRLGVGHGTQIDNTYYDTPDLRLATAGAALRVRCIRKGRGRRWLQTFKTGTDSDAALSVRGEWETPAPGGRLDPGRLASSPLASTLGGSRAGAGAQEGIKALRPVFRTVFERTTWHINLHGARLEAAIDIGELDAGGSREAIQEAEIELRAGPPSALYDLALQLCGASSGGHGDLGLLPFGSSKAARGYRLALGSRLAPRAIREADLSAMFSGRQRGGEAARQWVGRTMNWLLTAAAGMARSADPAFVHQARVALRRMRAGLDLLGSSAGAKDLDRTAIGAWADRFGKVRDWDVLIANMLPQLGEAAGPAGSARWARVRLAAVRRQAAARELLREQVATPEFATFALRVLRWSVMEPASPGKRLADIVPRAIRTRQRTVAAGARRFARLSLVRQHKVRIQAKNLRYGMEMMRRVLPKGGRRTYLRALAQFQDAAGGARDAALAQTAIARLTRSGAVLRQVREWSTAEILARTQRAQQFASALQLAR